MIVAEDNRAKGGVIIEIFAPFNIREIGSVSLGGNEGPRQQAINRIDPAGNNPAGAFDKIGITHSFG
jgi:hypothetical protein